MARPRKEGNQYFSLDVDFFSDKKIKILKARYGADGITLFLYLLCEIYKNGYYLKIDNDFKFIISDDLNMNCDKVEQVLAFLLERSMFDEQLFQSDAVLTSAGIQKRYQLMVKSRATKNPVIIERYWLLSKEETETFIKVNSFLNNSEKKNGYSEKNVSDSGKNDIKKRKEKERKENKSIETAAPTCFQNPALENAFLLFVACRKQNGQKLTEEQVSLLRKELEALGSNDEERIAIANKATVSGWKSFYPLKKPDGKQRGRSSNKFNNFHQREYDYGKLEAELLNSQEGENE